MKPVLRALLLAALAFGVLTAGAAAQTRTALIADGIDNQDTTPTLTPRAPSAEITDAQASYDSDSGTVSVSATYNTAPAQRLSLDLQLSGPRTCYSPEDERRDAVPDLVISMNYDSTGPPYGSSASVSGYDGRLSAPTFVSDDHRTISTTFTAPAFARRDYRCVQGRDASDGGRGDRIFSYFDGFEPQELTSSDALKALSTELSSRYGSRYTPAASSTWIRCPNNEIIDDSDDPSDHFALCEFRFLDSGKWRHGSVSFTLVDGALTVKYFGSSSFTKSLKGCSIRRNLRSHDPEILNRSLRADGFVSCQDSSASMVRDLDNLSPGVHRVGFHGTNRAGFEDSSVFRCVLRGHRGQYSAACVNKLRDRFVYRFTRRAKRAAPPRAPQRPPRRSCDSNYAGACLKPNVSDYDCAGGSGNGPYYVKGPIRVTGSDHYDLDADGDGVACE